MCIRPAPIITASCIAFIVAMLRAVAYNPVVVPVPDYHGCGSVRTVNLMRIYDPACVTRRIIGAVRTPDRIVVDVGNRLPAVVPHRPAVPSPGRYPHHVTRPIDILHGWPGPDVYNGTRTLRPGIGSHFARRFDNGSDAIDILVADDLKYRFSVAELFQFNDRDVLAFRFRNKRLENEGVDVAFVPVDNTDVIDVTIPVKVQVVHF